MRRISRTMFGILASASLLGGIGAAALSAVTATGGPAATVAAARISNPTAIEYGATMVEY